MAEAEDMGAEAEDMGAIEDIDPGPIALDLPAGETSGVEGKMRLGGGVSIG